MILHQDWREIPGFNDYAVNQYGDVANVKTGLSRSISMNNSGSAKVSIYDNQGRLNTRSVARLVADLFMEPDPNQLFATPIHLDGDKRNCRLDNLMWRPRWFAIRYHKQFWDERFHASAGPYMDVQSELLYDTVAHICVTNGLHFLDVHKGLLSGQPVFPTWQVFEAVDSAM